MTTPDAYARLTEREKQTLRMIVRGHDAKSIARHFDLSVHTINERLRDARRKLAVSSSREAARMVFEREGGSPIAPAALTPSARSAPEPLVPDAIGDAAMPATPHNGCVPADRGIRSRAPAGIAIGVSAMILTFALFLLAAPAAQTPAPPPAPAEVPAAQAKPAVIEAAARQWLTLLDQGRWDDSWDATAASFRQLNTRQVWAAASNRVRAPLGAVRSRTLLSRENLPAPPHGYDVVKFRTSFANKADAVETVALDYEGGAWRVVGVYVE